MYRPTVVALAIFASLLIGSTGFAANGLMKGNPNLKSAGPLAIGPDGVLFAADPQAATIFAIDTGDKSMESKIKPVNVSNLGQKIAALLGASADQIAVADMVVNPQTGNVFLSVSRGRGPQAQAVLLKINQAGKLSELPMKGVMYAKAGLPNAPAATPPNQGQQRQGRRNRPSPRSESITDMAFVGGHLFVAGLSNEEFASKLRSIPFPFKGVEAGTSVEVYHGAHGKLETRSPVRAFTTYEIDGQDHILAGYTCTPLVTFPVRDLKPDIKVLGRTVAELGNRNRPLDMFVYSKDGRDYILMANSARGVMKITTANIGNAPHISEKINGTAGLTYDTIDALKGIVQLDRLDHMNAVVISSVDGGAMDLKTVELP
ncbi:MAG: hypothetical protein ACYTGQ_04750 [Planctomycetota bacterium]|jgi:hypothetical protein